MISNHKSECGEVTAVRACGCKKKRGTREDCVGYFHHVSRPKVLNLLFIKETLEVSLDFKRAYDKKEKNGFRITSLNLGSLII
jgi:hypothetical protein